MFKLACLILLTAKEYRSLLAYMHLQPTDYLKQAESILVGTEHYLARTLFVMPQLSFGASSVLNDWQIPNLTDGGLFIYRKQTQTYSLLTRCLTEELTVINKEAKKLDNCLEFALDNGDLVKIANKYYYFYCY